MIGCGVLSIWFTQTLVNTPCTFEIFSIDMSLDGIIKKTREYEQQNNDKKNYKHQLMRFRFLRVRGPLLAKCGLECCFINHTKTFINQCIKCSNQCINHCISSIVSSICSELGTTKEIA